MSYLSIFKLKFEKVIVIFEISSVELFKMQKLLVQKKKKIKFRTKSALFGYFFQISKTIVIFQINTLELVKMHLNL